MFLRFNANHILPKSLYKMIIYNHFLSLTSLHIVGGLTIITSAASNKRSERRNSRPRFTLCCIPPVKIGHEWKVMVSHHYNQLQFVTINENYVVRTVGNQSKHILRGNFHTQLCRRAFFLEYLGKYCKLSFALLVVQCDQLFRACCNLLEAIFLLQSTAFFCMKYET